jgi:hypothetical protein
MTAVRTPRHEGTERNADAGRRQETDDDAPEARGQRSNELTAWREVPQLDDDQGRRRDKTGIQPLEARSRLPQHEPCDRRDEPPAQQNEQPGSRPASRTPLGGRTTGVAHVRPSSRPPIRRDKTPTC